MSVGKKTFAYRQNGLKNRRTVYEKIEKVTW